jgi:hypothetical protein
MNDGVNILLERMKTHPEEFVSDFSHGNTKWSRLVDFYDNVLTDEEKKAIKDGVIELNRAEFTKKVLEMLIEEPVPVPIIDEWSKAQTSYGSSTLSIKEAVLKEQEERMHQSLMNEMAKIRYDQLTSQTKQQKNQSKMEQLLKRVTGSKY